MDANDQSQTAGGQIADKKPGAAAQPLVMSFNSKAKSETASQDLLFINVPVGNTGLDAGSQKLVRSHAMKDVRRRRALKDGADDSPKMITPAPALPSGNGKRKKRSWSPIAKTANSKPSLRQHQSLLAKQVPRSNTGDRNKTGQSGNEGDPSELNAMETQRMAPQMQSIVQCSYPVTRAEARRTATPIGRNTAWASFQTERGKWSLPSLAMVEMMPTDGCIDPFDVLPMPNSERVRVLMQHYHKVFVSTNIPVNPKQAWLNDSLRDAAVFQATLSCSAGHLALLRHGADMSEALYLYFDTIRLINRRLIEHDMSDELMLAIATVALFEVAAQVPYPNALLDMPTSIHMDGLQQMVKLRGGLPSLGRDGSLRRLIAWAEIATAKLTNSKPRPLLTDTSYSKPLSESVWSYGPSKATTECIDLSIFLGKDERQTELMNVFRDLRRLCEIILEVPSSDVARMDSILFSDYVYAAEKQILLLSVSERSLAPCKVEDYMMRTCCCAAYLFIYIALRQIPVISPFFDVAVRQLKSAIDHPRYLVEASHTVPPILLWCLVLGAIASEGRQERPWFLILLSEIRATNEFQTVEDLRDHLEHIVWLEEAFRSSLAALWIELQESLRARVAGVLHGFQQQPTKGQAGVRSPHDYNLSCLDVG